MSVLPAIAISVLGIPSGALLAKLAGDEAKQFKGFVEKTAYLAGIAPLAYLYKDFLTSLLFFTAYSALSVREPSHSYTALPLLFLPETGLEELMLTTLLAFTALTLHTAVEEVPSKKWLRIPVYAAVSAAVLATRSFINL